MRREQDVAPSPESQGRRGDAAPRPGQPLAKVMEKLDHDDVIYDLNDGPWPGPNRAACPLPGGEEGKGQRQGSDNRKRPDDVPRDAGEIPLARREQNPEEHQKAGERRRPGEESDLTARVRVESVREEEGERR